MTEDAGELDASGCPDGLEQWVFDLESKVPDPRAVRYRDRKNGIITAYRDEQEAGFLMFGLGPGTTVPFTRIDTYEDFRCRGCATQLVEALRDAYPDLAVVDGGNGNSVDGDAVLATWRARGLVGDA